MANKKITELTEASTLVGTEVLPIVQDGVTKKVSARNLRPYKAYIALVTQEGINVPTSNILQNDFASVPTWTRINGGKYNLAFPTGTLTLDKTVPSVNGKQVFNRLIVEDGSGGTGVGYMYKSDADNIKLYSFSDVETFSDDILNNHLIEIFVYN